MESATMKTRMTLAPTTKGSVRIKNAFTYAAGAMAAVTLVTWAAFTLTNLTNSGVAKAATSAQLLHSSLEETTNGLKLLWQTDSKINNNFFTIEQSMDGTTYESIAVIAGDATVSGSMYEFVDHYPLLGKTYYRISLTDFDGNTQMFDPIVSNVDLNTLSNLFSTEDHLPL